MKGIATFLLIAFVLVSFAGVAFAKEISGSVTAVDAAKGTLKVKSEKLEAGFDCDGSLLKNVKVGDQVTVVYSEKGGKKTVTKITPMKMKPASGY